MRTVASALLLLTVAACASSPPPDNRMPNVYAAADPVYVPGTLVRCESVNNGRQTCRVDARTRMVSINQLCRAEFVLGY